MRFFVIAVPILAFSLAYSAEMPRLMSYQGLLTDAEGTPVSNGFYDLTFRLHDAPEGGEQLWQEDHTEVEVENGVFELMLGAL